jgi:hypothetical protein
MQKVIVILMLVLLSPASLLAQAMCDQTAVVDVASGATDVIVTGIAGRTVEVCGLVLTADTLTTTATISTGTGTTCGTSNVAISGGMRMVDEGNIVYGSGAGIILAPHATLICASLLRAA